MVVYQFRPPDDTWAAWKRTVPRDKSLETRLIELIEADTEGRVQEVGGSPRRVERDVPEPEPDPVEFPNTVNRDAGEAAIQAAVAYIEEQGRATKKDLVQAVMPDHSLGYDVEKAIDQVETPGERFRGAWWRRVVKPGLDVHPDIVKPNTQASEWRHNG